MISAACKVIEGNRGKGVKPNDDDNLLMDVSKISTPPISSGIKIQSMRIQLSYFEVESR